MEDVESVGEQINLYKSPISEPMATEKLSAKLLTLVKKCKIFSLTFS